MSQESVDIARRSLDAFNAGDYDAALGFLAPDVEWEHNIGLATPMEGTYRGRAEVRQLWDRILEAFEDAHFEVDDGRDLGDEVLVLGRLSTRGRGSGAAVATPFGSIGEVRDGLIVRQRFFVDRCKALEAVGLSG
jgi:ketosteroid isomerase-like protein